METNGFILLVTLSDLGDPVARIAEVLSQRPSAIHGRVHSRKSLNLLERYVDLNLERVHQGAWFGKSCLICAAVVAFSVAI